MNGTLVNSKPELSWNSNYTSKLFRESYTPQIQSDIYTFSSSGMHTLNQSQLTQDFIIPQDAQLFNTISYYVVNYNSQGWPSLRSNAIFYEIDGGGGGIGGF